MLAGARVVSKLTETRGAGVTLTSCGSDTDSRVGPAPL